MALHRWTAQALALRTPCLQPSKSIHASQAAGVLCGLATTIRTVHGDAYPFEVSERAIESYSGVGAPLCEPGYATWKDAPGSCSPTAISASSSPNAPTPGAIG